MEILLLIPYAIAGAFFAHMSVYLYWRLKNRSFDMEEYYRKNGYLIGKIALFILLILYFIIVE